MVCSTTTSRRMQFLVALLYLQLTKIGFIRPSDAFVVVPRSSPLHHRVLSTSTSHNNSDGAENVNTFGRVATATTSHNECAKTDASSSSSRRSSTSVVLYMGFFSDMFKDAFANDQQLSSSDRTSGQLDYQGEDDDFLIGAGQQQQQQQQQQTDVQKRWIESQQRQKQQRQQQQQQQQLTAVRGAPVNPNLLVGTRWKLDLYLAGVPDRDPSNNLYGNKVNISSRDRDLGLGTSLPDDPNLSVMVALEENGVCRAEPSEFTTGAEGEYRLSDDQKFIRFSMDTLGFQRVISTTGTITKVAWSNGEDTVQRSSSTYSIPVGTVYADTPIGYGRPGELVMGSSSSSSTSASSVRSPGGVLRIEQRTGVLGASTKMVTCGKFSASMIMNNE